MVRSRQEFEIDEYEGKSQQLMSDKLTDDIRVRAYPYYVEQQSNPSKGEYLFSYRIVITNKSRHSIQLLSRHWIVINANGDIQEVKGEGVVGKTPELKPGESFEYASFCPLNTEWGTMEGSYEMERKDGSRFVVAVGRFFLTTTAPKMVMSI